MLLLPGSTQTTMRKVTSCRKIFEVGSRLLIRGKITTSPADYDTLGPRRGFSEAMPSRNGSCPDRVPFCGFMANVRSFLLYTFTEIDDFPHS